MEPRNTLTANGAVVRKLTEFSVPTPVHIIFKEGDPYHKLILGASSQGKSIFLKEEACRLGISYEELLQRMCPTK